MSLLGIAENYNPEQASSSSTTGKSSEQKKHSFMEERGKLGRPINTKSVGVNWEFGV